MKKFIGTITLLATFSFVMAFSTLNGIKPMEQPLILDIKPAEIQIIEVKLEPVKLELKDHNAFLQAIGHRESGNRYEIVNRFGYMGKYQFGKSTLKGLGFKLTQDEFINSPYIQEKAMQELLLHNRKKLDKFICKYEGKYIHGILITESGVLEAAHLAGAGNVRKFFRKGYEFKDGFGTKMTTYMTQFSGYSLNL